jgi:hypothetical protein
MTESFFRFWPLFEGEEVTDAEGRSESSSARFLAPWFWGGGNAPGVDEAYDFLWTLWKRTTRGATRETVRTVADVYTSRREGDHVQRSVPWLFSYEGDREAGTLRLFHLLPIPWSGTGADRVPSTTEGRETR